MNRLVPLNEEPSSERSHLESPHLYTYILPSEKTCRICLEPETSDNPLIHPCRCTGSVKYVHEECMKTWIISQTDELLEAKCEICHTMLSMHYTIIRKCSISQALNESLAQCIFAPLLFSVLSMLGLILFLLIERYMDKETSDSEKTYSMILIIVSVFASWIIMFLLFEQIKEICLVSKMTDWFIEDEFFEEEEQREKEETLNMTVMNEPAEISVMVIPRVITIRGRRIEAPELNPLSLTPVSRNGVVVAFKTESNLSSFNSSIKQGLDWTGQLERMDREPIHEVNEFVPPCIQSHSLFVK